MRLRTLVAFAAAAALASPALSAPTYLISPTVTTTATCDAGSVMDLKFYAFNGRVKQNNMDVISTHMSLGVWYYFIYNQDGSRAGMGFQSTQYDGPPTVVAGVGLQESPLPKGTSTLTVQVERHDYDVNNPNPDPDPINWAIGERCTGTATVTTK